MVVGVGEEVFVDVDVGVDVPVEIIVRVVVSTGNVIEEPIELFSLKLDTIKVMLVGETFSENPHPQRKTENNSQTAAGFIRILILAHRDDII